MTNVIEVNPHDEGRTGVSARDERGEFFARVVRDDEVDTLVVALRERLRDPMVKRYV